MAKNLLSIAGALLCSGLMAFTASAQDPGEISGYFRVSNAETGKYVEVTGPFSADPTQTKADAQYKAGTVIFVEAQQPEKEYAYEVTSLRSQGIEVVGNYIDDYYDTLIDILRKDGNYQADNAALWTLVRNGFKYGYTSIGRAAIQLMIYIVAQRLDDEGYSDKAAKELANFADRFNKEVARYIDLGIRLEPVEGAENTFRLYYETPDLQPVSDWYLKQENGKYVNKETFEKGFDAMRQYLGNKMGLTGEGFDPDEVKEMADWGYVLPEEYRQKPNSDGVFVVSYEEIFADPTLLFNWLKLNVIKFTDVNRCPDIDLQGIRLRAFAEEMQKHRLTQQIISYLPKVQTNQRIYLCDGKNGVTGHFDFTSQQGADALGELAQWKMHPVDNENEKLFVKDGASYYGKNYWAVYYDFPVSAVDETTAVNLLSAELPDEEKFKGYTFVELVETEEIPLQTPLVVCSENAETQLKVADGNWTITDLKPLPVAPDGFAVSDQVADKQCVKRRAGGTETTNEHFTGNLLSAKYTTGDLQNYPGIDAVNYYALVFYGSQVVEELPGSYLAFGAGQELMNATIVPNSVLYVNSYESMVKENRVLIWPEEIPVDIVVIPTDTGEEETDGDNENEHIRIAQAFDGTQANVFTNLVSFSMELIPDKDFTVKVKVFDDEEEEDWVTPSYDNDLQASYKEIFGENSESWVQYNKYFGGLSVENMSEDFVDGFYLFSHLDHENTAVLEDEPTANEDRFEYDLTFDAPCSGIYEITVAPVDGSPVSFEPAVHKVKIYPNLYAQFGESKVPGFFIDHVGFTKVSEERYEISLPQGHDLENCTAYIPGTYFASKLTCDLGDGVKQNLKMRREQGENGQYVYSAALPPLTDIVESGTPLTMTVEKNGVSKAYDFYVTNTRLSGIDDVVVGEEANDADAVYYNLQGVKVANPENGVYLKVVNGKAVKVAL